jgi:nicotinate-nucleotide adenylyltransferase
LVNHPKPVVALFGGSFDPPHRGHQQIVRQAVSLLDIDRLIIVPAYLNPFKRTSLARPEKRLEWCHLLFDAIPNVIVDDYEVKQGKSIRTSQTVKHFNTRYDVKYLIIGSDNLSTLTDWHAFEWLDAHVTWVIVTREGHPIKTEKLRSWEILEIDFPVSSTHIREKIDLHNVDNKIKQSVHKTLKENKIMTTEERIENIVKILDKKKAEEIEVFNLEHADYIAKYVVIANSLNGKHTISLFEHLKKDLKPFGETFLASDISDDWAVADLGDILIHIMIPEYRQRYSLETFLSELVENQKKSHLP